MKLTEYFELVWKSLNPNKHREMAELSFFDLFKYLAFIVLLSLLVSVFLLLPTVTGYTQVLGNELESFDTFSLDVNASVDRPVTVLSKPGVAVDFNKSSIDDEWILFTNESMFVKKFIFFGSEEFRYSDYQSVTSEKSASLYSKIIVLLLPAILFWISVLFLLKNLLLALVFFIIGYLLFSNSKNEITLSKTVKVALFTATPALFLDLALWPITVMYVIPFLTYLALFFIGLVMVSDRKYRK